MGMHTKIDSEQEHSELGTGRELVELLMRAEEKAKEMAYQDIEKCLRLAIHLIKLKSGMD